MNFDYFSQTKYAGFKVFSDTKSYHTLIFFSVILPSLDMPLGTFTIYGMLKLREFLAYAGVNILQQNRKLFPDKNDQKWVTFPNLLSKLSKKGKLFPDGYPQIM